MRNWLFYKMNINSTKDFVRSVEKNLASLELLKGSKSFSHSIEYIVCFPNPIFGFNRKRKIFFQSETSKDRKDAFWHSFTEEQDLLKTVKEKRRDFLFGNVIKYAWPDQLKEVVNEFITGYSTVKDFDDEIDYLKNCQEKGLQRIMAFEQLSSEQIRALRQDWTQFTKTWFGHTNKKSFPFLCRSIDLNNAFGIHLKGSDDKKVIYGIVKLVE